MVIYYLMHICIHTCSHTHTYRYNANRDTQHPHILTHTHTHTRRKWRKNFSFRRTKMEIRRRQLMFKLCDVIGKEKEEGRIGKTRAIYLRNKLLALQK